MKPRFSPFCDRSYVKMADRFASRRYSLKNKLGDRMIKQLLNSIIAKYRNLSVSRRSIISLSLRLRQIIDLLATDKSQYFAQPRPISNGNRTEWSPIRSVIIRVINKIGRPRSGSSICLITSMITDRIGRHEVLLQINHNFNKICDIIGNF